MPTAPFREELREPRRSFSCAPLLCPFDRCDRDHDHTILSHRSNQRRSHGAMFFHLYHGVLITMRYLLPVLTLCITVHVAQAGTYLCPVSADVNSYYSWRQYAGVSAGAKGTDTTMTVQYNWGVYEREANYIYMKFNMSAIPDHDTVTAATLHMRLYHYVGEQPTVALTREDWTENPTSFGWYDQPGATGATLATAGDWSSWAGYQWTSVSLDLTHWDSAGDVADDVTAVRLACSTYDKTQFYTHEYDGGSSAAYLEVTSVPEPATLVMLAASGIVAVRRRQCS